jgi:hypothetical protein
MVARLPRCVEEARVHGLLTARVLKRQNRRFMEWTVGDFEDLLRPDGVTPMLFSGHEGWEFAV